MEFSVCEVKSTFFVACFSTVWGMAIRFIVVKCCDGRTARRGSNNGRGGGTTRAPITASCDVVKAGFGTLAAFLVVCLDEALFFSNNLWALLLRWIIVVGASLPVSLLCWHLICNNIRHRIADGEIQKNSILRALQCSGRYNPRQRMGLEDGDCLDFRIEDEAPVAASSSSSSGGGDVVSVSAAPLTSWWAFQCLVWFLVQGSISALLAALFTSWQHALPSYDPAELIGKALEGVLFLSCEGEETGPQWAATLGLTMLLASVSTTVTDASQRYHGRLAHAGLTEPGEEDGFTGSTLNSLGGGGGGCVEAHDGTAAVSSGGEATQRGPRVFSSRSKHDVAAAAGAYL